MPTWSYDVATGTWSPMGDQLVTLTAEGELGVSVETEHLSYFMGGWPSLDSADRCRTSRPIQVEGNEANAVLSFRVTGEHGGYVTTFDNTSRHVRQLVDDPNELVVPGAPRALPVQVEAFLENTRVGQVAVADLCDTAAGAILFPVNLQRDVADLTVVVHDVCPDDPRLSVAVPSVPVWFRRVDGGPKFQPAGVTADVTGALVLAGLELGGEYEIQALDRRSEQGTYASKRLVVTKQATVEFNFDLPDRCGSPDSRILSFTLADNAAEIHDEAGAHVVPVQRLVGSVATLVAPSTEISPESLAIALTLAPDRGEGTQRGELVVTLDPQSSSGHVVARFSPLEFRATASGVMIDIGTAGMILELTDQDGRTESRESMAATNRVLTRSSDGATLTFDAAALSTVMKEMVLPPIQLGGGGLQYAVNLKGIALRLATGGSSCPDAASCQEVSTIQGTIRSDESSVPGEELALIVNRAGDGRGNVDSLPSGIDCGAQCGALFPQGETVTLTALAEPGSVFRGWDGGGCSGTEPCAVQLDVSQTVTATFVSGFSLTVSRSGSGSGTVVSDPIGIDCGDDCTEGYVKGALVTLTAIPDTGSEFSGWSGVDCPGTGPCMFRMEFSGMVAATFDLVPQTNTLPMANAGADQTVENGTKVILDGRGSDDPDNGPQTLTYAWTLTTKPVRSAAVLSNPASPMPTFVADRIGTYKAELVVNDGADDSTPDTVTITATIF